MQQTTTEQWTRASMLHQCQHCCVTRSHPSVHDLVPLSLRKLTPGTAHERLWGALGLQSSPASTRGPRALRREVPCAAHVLLMCCSCAAHVLLMCCRAGWHAVRGRAQPPAPGKDAEAERQPAPAVSGAVWARASLSGASWQLLQRSRRLACGHAHARFDAAGVGAHQPPFTGGHPAVHGFRAIPHSCTTGAAPPAHPGPGPSPTLNPDPAALTRARAGMSPPTTWTWRRCAAWRRRLTTLRGRCSSSPTTGGWGHQGGKEGRTWGWAPMGHQSAFSGVCACRGVWGGFAGAPIAQADMTLVLIKTMNDMALRIAAGWNALRNAYAAWRLCACASTSRPPSPRGTRSWFLDRMCTHILAFEDNSQAVWFPGNFSEYEEDRLVGCLGGASRGRGREAPSISWATGLPASFLHAVAHARTHARLDAPSSPNAHPAGGGAPARSTPPASSSGAWPTCSHTLAS